LRYVSLTQRARYQRVSKTIRPANFQAAAMALAAGFYPQESEKERHPARYASLCKRHGHTPLAWVAKGRQ